MQTICGHTQHRPEAGLTAREGRLAARALDFNGLQDLDYDLAGPSVPAPSVPGFSVSMHEGAVSALEQGVLQAAGAAGADVQGAAVDVAVDQVGGVAVARARVQLQFPGASIATGGGLLAQPGAPAGGALLPPPRSPLRPPSIGAPVGMGMGPFGLFEQPETFEEGDHHMVEEDQAGFQPVPGVSAGAAPSVVSSQFHGVEQGVQGPFEFEGEPGPGEEQGAHEGLGEEEGAGHSLQPGGAAAAAAAVAPAAAGAAQQHGRAAHGGAPAKKMLAGLLPLHKLQVGKHMVRLPVLVVVHHASSWFWVCLVD